MHPAGAYRRYSPSEELCFGEEGRFKNFLQKLFPCASNKVYTNAALTYFGQFFGLFSGLPGQKMVFQLLTYRQKWLKK